VVGGVGGVALLGAAAFFLLKRRKRDPVDLEVYQPENDFDDDTFPQHARPYSDYD
jgi:LPXTG-motif cell wall-anchored protein